MAPAHVAKTASVVATKKVSLRKKKPVPLEQQLLDGWRPKAFVAMDFETANQSRNSACALSVVRVEGRKIVERVCHLIRPSSPYFEFTYLHGLAWKHVQGDDPTGPEDQGSETGVEGSGGGRMRTQSSRSGSSVRRMKLDGRGR